MDLEVAIKDLEKTLAEVQNIQSDEGRRIMSNYDDFISDLKFVIKTKIVALYLERAKRFYDDEKKIMEKDGLLSAYSEIKQHKISDTDLKAAKLQSYITGNILTKAAVEKRLEKLGWMG